MRQVRVLFRYFSASKRNTRVRSCRPHRCPARGACAQVDRQLLTHVAAAAHTPVGSFEPRAGMRQVNSKHYTRTYIPVKLYSERGCAFGVHASSGRS